MLAWLQKLFPQGQANDISTVDCPGSNPEAHGDARTSAGGADGGFINNVLIRNPDDAAEYPLALGNLFRAQGDIARAVRLRESCIAAPDTSATLKARVYFELGRDYRKAGFLDRALTAYKEARKRGFSSEMVGGDLAQLYADSGDFINAAEEFSRLGNTAAQACYLVQQAEECAAQGNDLEAARLLRQALHVHAGSPEARLALAAISLLGNDASRCVEEVLQGLTIPSPPARLILLEGLYSFIKGPAGPDIDRDTLSHVLAGLDVALGGLPPDLTLCYYAGLFAEIDADNAKAEQWYTKALVLDPDFWASRLAILALAASRENLPPLLAAQVAFFTEQGARSKRFLCPPCGLRRDTIFSQCPRCLAWHSAAFRTRLI